MVEQQASSVGSYVVVMGDMNDFDNTVKDASGNMPISQVLNILRDPVKDKAGDGMYWVVIVIIGIVDIAVIVVVVVALLLLELIL